MKNILTIAGFDPSSGAGVTRDLDVYFSLGLHGIAAPTSAVIQGPQGVRNVYPMPFEMFQTTLQTIHEEMSIDGVKVGSLGDERYVEALSAFLPEYPDIPIVVDPVLTSKNGTKLLSDRGLKGLIKSIFPRTTVMTPNLDEASLIVGDRIRTLKEMEGCARAIAATGPQAVVMKGGHLRGAPVDLLFDGSCCTTWKRKRIDRVIHGTGCTFSSLLVSFLVHGYSIKEAFLASEGFMDSLVKEAYPIGKEGYSYLSPGLLNHRLAERWMVFQAMSEAKERLGLLNLIELIPDGQMNLAYALEGAQGIEDVAAFPGRIGRHRDRLIFKGEPRFGASTHVARFILAIIRYFPQIRSCAGIRYSKTIIRKAQEKGLHAIFCDRTKEPSKVREQLENSHDHLVSEALKDVDNPPDIIYDEGDIGEEPLIRLFARSPLELIKKMEIIAR